MCNNNEKSHNVPLLIKTQKSDFRSGRNKFSCNLNLSSYLLFGKCIHVSIDVVVMRKIEGKREIVAFTLMNRQNYS